VYREQKKKGKKIFLKLSHKKGRIIWGFSKERLLGTATIENFIYS